MKFIPINSISGIYECIQFCVMKWHWVDHEKLHTFSLALRKFERLLGEEKDEELWQQFLRPLKRFRFRLCATPLPFNHPRLAINDIEKIAVVLSRVQYLYPELGVSAQKLFTMVKLLLNCNDTPLLELLTSLSYGKFPNKTALLLKDPRMIPPVREAISKNPTLREIELIRFPQLCTGNVYKKLLVIGPTRWFPEYVFNAPRAKEIHLINFNWIKDHWQPEPAFLSHGGQSINQEPAPVESVVDKNRRVISTEQYVDAEEILPSINWHLINIKYTCGNSNTFRPDFIQARLFLLEEGYGVFLDSEKNSRNHVINLDVDLDEDPYCRMSTSDIQPGMYILLRTGDRGDYIYEIADKIIGDKAIEIRETQKNWKNLLWEQVSQRGLGEVSIALQQLGSPISNEVNLRNWASKKNIKPRDEKDFAAIMKLIGLEHKAKEYWENASALELAHRKAGHHISELLLKQVKKSDLSLLESTGIMDFQLPEVDGGILTAFRIEDISPDTFPISSSQVGRPIERDELYG